MPTQAKVFGCEAFEDAGLSIMSRVKGNSATNITQASLTSITYVVMDKSDASVIVASTALTVSAVVFDALQTDSRWTVDTTGYNFRHDLAAASFPNGARTYRVEYVFTPTSGAVFVLAVDVSTIDLFRS